MDIKFPYFVSLNKTKSNQDIIKPEGAKFTNICGRVYRKWINTQKLENSIENIKLDFSNLYQIDKVEVEGEKVKYGKNYVKLNRPYYTLVGADKQFPRSMHLTMNSFDHFRLGRIPCKRYYTSPKSLGRHFQTCAFLSVDNFEPWYKIAKITHVKKLKFPKYLCTICHKNEITNPMTLLQFTWYPSSSMTYVRLINENCSNIFTYDKKFMLSKEGDEVRLRFDNDTNHLLALL